MAVAKPKKPHRTSEDLESIKADVASFASSLGLASGFATPSAGGFDDSDFRKSGPLKPHQSKQTLGIKVDGGDIKPNKSKRKPHPLDIDPFRGSIQKKEPYGLPLMKAEALADNWYAEADKMETRVFGVDGGRKMLATHMEEVKKLAERKKEVAEALMEKYVNDYNVSRKRNGNIRLLESTVRSGTSMDKVSAFTSLVEDNPIANMRSLDALLSMVTSKVGKRYAFTGFAALRELFILRLLPNRKLKCLLQHPLDILPETKDGFSLLLFWYWEECLKQRYERFIIALEEALKDMLYTFKEKALKIVYDLLLSKPEQERRLLADLVNKLGDPGGKIASDAQFHLKNLLREHPNMKGVVIDETDSFIFRPHVGLRAKHNAINFLSEIRLTAKADGRNIAKRLVDIYFALFKVLISGVHDDDASTKDKKDRVRGKGNMHKKSNLKHGDYQKSKDCGFEMDSRLLTALLRGVNRAFPFVANHEADDVVETQTPILFKLVHCENFNVGLQALKLLYHITTKNQIASDRFYRALYSKLLSPAVLKSSQPEMLFMHLEMVLKNDVNLKRVAAFSKRLLQVSLQGPPQYACKCLLLLSEVLKAKPPLWSLALQNESVDDDLEHFEDIKEETEDPHGIFSSSDLVNSEHVNHSAEHDQVHVMTNGKELVSPVKYNPQHREPSYCRAEMTSWWELTILATHAHPSVAVMARTLLSGSYIIYGGDPLNDLSLAAFLDKFMEKKAKMNLKANGVWHGGSQIAPSKKLEMKHHFIGEELLELAEEDVPPEDIFFHRYYANKASSLKKPKEKKKKASELDGPEDELLQNPSESDEDEIDQVLGSTSRISLQEEPDEGYDYDDLDGIPDDDLLGDGSDDDIQQTNRGFKGQVDENDIDVEDAVGFDSDDDDLKRMVGGKRGRQQKKAGASPFASLEEYEHLINENDDDDGDGGNKDRKSSWFSKGGGRQNCEMSKPIRREKRRKMNN